MTEADNRVQKAYKKVEQLAAAARETVSAAQRNARTLANKEKMDSLSREVKRMKRQDNLTNMEIADRLGIPESSVRTLLLWRIKGEV